MQSGPNGHQPRETAGHKKISKAFRNIPGKKLATFQENPGRKVLLNFEGGGSLPHLREPNFALGKFGR